MLRPGFFRLGRGIKRVLGCAAEPLLGFVTPARSFKFESRRDILARLRVHRRAADAEVGRVLRSFEECGGGFDVTARLLMLFGQRQMRAAVKAERRSFSLARGEGVAL